jgi:hypothetical protein
VERWEGNEAAVATIGRKTSPEENGIPAAPWPHVKDALIKMYESEELRSLAYQVSDVETLLHIQSRAGALSYLLKREGRFSLRDHEHDAHAEQS